MSLSSPHIRTAVSSDVHAIRRCAHDAYRQYIERMNQKPAPMIADFDDQVSRGIVSVAIAKDGLVGFVVYYPVDDHMHLENVAVLPSHKGLGIGKRLIQHVEEQAVASGMDRVELYTNEMMHENLIMYPILGYQETGRKTQAGFNRVFFSKTIL